MHPNDENSSDNKREHTHLNGEGAHSHGHHDHSHGHSHDHGHGHNHSHDFDFSQVNTGFIIAITANLAFTILEAVYGFMSNSVSLLGDAGHNLSDVLGLLLAWGASYLATRKSSELYSYGFRKTTILAAIINAVTLVFAAGFIAIESIERFFTPSPMDEVVVMIVASIGILVNAGTAMLFMKGSKEDLNLKGAYLHLAYDAAISAAVVVGACVSFYTGWLLVDPLLGLIIVVVILLGTWGLLRDSTNLILDAVPEGCSPQGVKQYLEGIAGVSEVHDLHIWAMSTFENCMTAHLVMPENTLWESEASYDEIGLVMKRDYNIHHITLQVEKDFSCLNNNC
jgi:cobalt-zinc-cadmium efflux system protein